MFAHQVFGRGKSALGQKQTFAVQNGMSALPPKADVAFDYLTGPLTNNFALKVREFVGYLRVVHNLGGPLRIPKSMYKRVAVVSSLMMALICSAAAKNAISVHVNRCLQAIL